MSKLKVWKKEPPLGNTYYTWQVVGGFRENLRQAVRAFNEKFDSIPSECYRDGSYIYMR